MRTRSRRLEKNTYRYPRYGSWQNALRTSAIRLSAPLRPSTGCVPTNTRTLGGRPSTTGPYSSNCNSRPNTDGLTESAKNNRCPERSVISIERSCLAISAVRTSTNAGVVSALAVKMRFHLYRRSTSRPSRSANLLTDKPDDTCSPITRRASSADQRARCFLGTIGATCTSDFGKVSLHRTVCHERPTPSIRCS